MSGGRALPSLGTAARVCALVVLAWLVLAVRFGGSGTPYLALPAVLADSTNLSRSAQRGLAQAKSGDEAGAKASRDAAAGLAAAALDASPLDSDAVRILGFVADIDGRTGARRLIETAAARNTRDGEAQVWLILDDLQRGDYPGALSHLVVTQRVSRAMLGTFLPLVKAVAAEPEGRKALTALLEQGPPWRTPLLQSLSAGEDTAEASVDLLSRLAEGRARPTPDEYAPLLRRMVGEGKFDPAYLLWLELMPPDPEGAGRNVYNGGFDRPLTGSPFDWTISAATGAWSGIADDRRTGNRQLRVVFSDYSGPFQGVSQTLLLTPGEYVLSVTGATDGLASRRGLWWRITCVGGAVLGTTAPVLGTTPAKPLDARFSVPGTACPAQTLRLELAARGTLEGSISGEATFDDAAIRRVDGSGTR